MSNVNVKFYSQKCVVHVLTLAFQFSYKYEIGSGDLSPFQDIGNFLGMYEKADSLTQKGNVIEFVTKNRNHYVSNPNWYQSHLWCYFVAFIVLSNHYSFNKINANPTSKTKVYKKTKSNKWYSDYLSNVWNKIMKRIPFFVLHVS